MNTTFHEVFLSSLLATRSHWTDVHSSQTKGVVDSGQVQTPPDVLLNYYHGNGGDAAIKLALVSGRLQSEYLL